MADVWSRLGLTGNPYDVKPLEARESDVELLIGRIEEGISLSVKLQSEKSGVLIISGNPGVGKTSFLNVQQYLLETGQDSFGPRLLAARKLSQIQPLDEPRNIAIRCIDSLCSSIQSYCKYKRLDVPKRVEQVRQWLDWKGTAALNVGFDIAGYGVSFGREMRVPNVDQITFEGLVDILGLLRIDILENFNLTGFIIVLDNAENMDDDLLRRTLMSFRDNLFVIPNAWWVIIGQSGLASLIQATDPRVSQRIIGAIELSAISSEELKMAIDKRIHKFHESGNGNSPISEKVITKLYNSSNGEIRFVLKYCHNICTAFIEDVCLMLVKAGVTRRELAMNLEKSLGDHLVKNQIPDDRAMKILKQIVKAEFDGFHLKKKECDVLSEIGRRKTARAIDHKHYAVRSNQDFSSNYLNKFAKMGLLFRIQEGKAVMYQLRGISLLAKEFDII